MIIYKAGEFEGTLDELREGIRARQIDLYKVPLAEITEQFIETLNKLKRAMPLADLSSFYLALAYLLWLKSRLLLPGLPRDDDDEDIDMRDKLVDALEKLRFSKYMVLLSEYKEQHALELNRRDVLFRLPLTSEDLFKDATVDTLAKTFYALMRRATEREEAKLQKNGGADVDPTSILNPYEAVTVNEKYALLLEFFEEKTKVLFTELCKNVMSRDHIVCAFFATIDAIADKKATVELIDNENDFYLVKKEVVVDDANADEGDREYDRFIESEMEREFHEDAKSEYDEDE